MAKVPSSKAPLPPAGEPLKSEVLAQSAKKRAATRGEQYLLRAYHGSTKTFPLSELQPTTASGFIGAGYNVTPERDMAARYAAGIRKGFASDADIARKLRDSTGNVLEMDIPFNEARVFEQNPSMRTPDMADRFGRMIRKEGLDGAVHMGQHSPVMRFQHAMMKKYGDDYYDQYIRAMREAGFDFVRDTRGGLEEIAVLDPKGIRAVADKADDDLMSSRMARSALSTARRAMTSPTAKRLAATAVGLGIPKVAGAVMSGPAGLARDTIEAPAYFVRTGYPMTQDPYQQLKYAAETTGRPLDRMDPNSFATLPYEAVVRARQEGYLTPEAEEQYVKHVKDTEGVDVRAAYALPSRGLR